MDSFDKFNDTELPCKDKFYSSLYNENISDEDYNRALLVWRHFNIQNMGEYNDLYLQTDVLLLSDIFENFRNKCMDFYGLDPVYYFTLPNYAWDVMLKMTGVELEPVIDVDMYQMIEKGLRGGMCQVSHKHAVANNKYMDNYNPDNESSFI